MTNRVKEFQDKTKRAYLLYLWFSNKAYDANFDNLYCDSFRRAYGKTVGEYYNPSVPVAEHEKDGVEGSQEEFMSLMNEMLEMAREFIVSAARKREMYEARRWAEIEKAICEDIELWEDVFDSWRMLDMDIRGYMFLLTQLKKMGDRLLRDGNTCDAVRLIGVADVVDSCKVRIKALKEVGIEFCATPVLCNVGASSIDNFNKLHRRIDAYFEKRLKQEAENREKEFHAEQLQKCRAYYANPNRVFGVSFLNTQKVANNSDMWFCAVLHPERYLREVRCEKARLRKVSKD